MARGLVIASALLAGSLVRAESAPPARPRALVHAKSRTTWIARRELAPSGADRDVAVATARGGHLGLLDLAGRPHFDPLPWFLRGDGSARDAAERELVREVVTRGSLIAYTRRFTAAGRDWLLRTDGSLVAADLVRPFRRSNFHGVVLGGAVNLPIAWLRDGDAAKYAMGPSSARPATSSWPRRTAIALDPQRRSLSRAGQRYLRTRESHA